MVLPAGAIKLAVLSFVFAALAITALAFRLWSRHMMRNRLQFNDYAAMMAMVNLELKSTRSIRRLC